MNFEMHCFSFNCTGDYRQKSRGAILIENQKRFNCFKCSSVLVRKTIGKKQERMTGIKKGPYAKKVSSCAIAV